MNCHDIESLILAERDGGLTKDQLAALSDHVVTCPACHQFRSRLHAALDSLKTEVAAVTVPDADDAWHELQARLHRPAHKSPLAPVISRSDNQIRHLFWFSVPLAAAAIAFAFFLTRPSTPTPSVEVTVTPPPPPLHDPSIIAGADYVEAGDPNASTLVYVDKESGWLVVWTTEADTDTKG